MQQGALGAHRSIPDGKNALDGNGRGQMIPMLDRKVEEGQERHALVDRAVPVATICRETSGRPKRSVSPSKRLQFQKTTTPGLQPRQIDGRVKHLERKIQSGRRRWFPIKPRQSFEEH